MKKFLGVATALVLLAGACEAETGNSGSGSAINGFGGGGRRADAAERRIEARRERQREQRRLARIERRREARLAALRRERRAQARRERAEQAAAAAPAPAESCTHGYDPCLPPAADYDCEGGTGDGPAYTGYVTVTGYDPYDLDSDNDGAGCES